MTSRNPFVFLVGCPRSGTTLLRRMLDAHPDLAITPETHWIPELFEQRVGLDNHGAVTKELVQALSRHRKFVRLGITADELAALAGDGHPTSYSSFVSRVFDLYGRKRGKPLVGDKTPGYVRKIGALNALWPRARYVHLIRDGRDVCLSVLDWDRAERTAGRFATWVDDPVSTAGLWWEWNVCLGREVGEQLGRGRYVEAGYEALVADPKRACIELCSFLGLVFDDAMLRYHEARTKTKSGLDAKHAWLPPTPGLRNWRSEMEFADLERFEAVAGSLLDELGYERAVPHPGAEAVETASRLRSAFIDELHGRGRPVPRPWQALWAKAGNR
jgi:hypothetical protein